MAKLQGMIPDCLAKNLFVLLTNINLKPNFNIKNVMESRIDEKKIFYYNNQIFKVNPQEFQNHNIQQQADQSFRSSIETLTLLEKMALCKTKSTVNFRKIKDLRDRLNYMVQACNDKDTKIGIQKKELQDLAGSFSNVFEQEQTRQNIDAKVNRLSRELEDHHNEIQRIIAEMKKVCSQFDYLEEIKACLNVLEEQIDALTSEYGVTLNMKNASKLSELKEKKAKMLKFKEDLIKYSSPKDQSAKNDIQTQDKGFFRSLFNV